MRFPYEMTPPDAEPLGLIVLQADETIESDMRRMLPPDVPFFISRVASGAEVTPRALRAMADQLTGAARLLPPPLRFAAVGYGCTSATAQIGAAKVARLIGAGVRTARVTDPLTALCAACAAMEVTRLAFLSPYVADVSDRLRDALTSCGIASPVFGSFDEAVETHVARIAPASLIAAACDLAAQGGTQAIFLSRTNLRTLDVIEEIEAHTGLICFSSNQVLAWHLNAHAHVPGKLGAVSKT